MFRHPGGGSFHYLYLELGTVVIYFGAVSPYKGFARFVNLEF